ncbi:DUF4197 domain-containing protein [Chitinophaga agrisoli]|uniref:DUF4197 domain-containing protein n=1 Tax=Chitinophaga agrisoli TaxID=2607653 RepID=A0A5B2VXZ8_9BACT|nr:DUF4197 domain-containing protein [Chitinophaga agrisoli]KAA2244733.1 DUF4197 domain-containing protein [Chitinophaga agrisoli]
MKKSILLMLPALLTLQLSQAQLLKKLKDKMESSSTATKTSSSSTPQSTGNAASGKVTESEAGSGIKQALSKGVSAGIAALSKKDGFFGNEAYKMFLPEDAQKIEKTLRSIGLGSQVDKAILQINRAAEGAVTTAAPIFGNAIQQMTVTDALKLVTGGNNSVTDYFKGKTTDQLKSAFAPNIQSALDSTSATKYYANIVNTYNKLPTTMTKVNPDLKDYVTSRAVAALFDQIGKEEANIRANPAAQTTDLLKKVFGK